jgi:hypothetical protein
MPAVSLEDLQQQITQRELELQTLRQELEARQSELATLVNRKKDLLAQLHQVEAEMAALAANLPSQAAVPEVPNATLPPISSLPDDSQPKLADLIVTMLRQAGKPMTSRQLQEEALRRGYRSSSRNFVKTIEVRIQDLKQKGVLRRASTQPGYVLALSAKGVKAETTKQSRPASSSERTKKATTQVARPTKPSSSTKKGSNSGATTSKPVKATEPVRQGRHLTLREVLTNLLKKSNRLLSGRELAEQAQAAGYRSNSAKFADVVWTMLGQMDNVEHVPGKGYRFNKNAKAKT